MVGLSDANTAEEAGDPNPVFQWVYLNQFKLKLVLVDVFLIALGFLIAKYFGNDLAQVVAAMLIWFGLLFALTGVILYAYIRFSAWRSDR
ncbi:hypothetical protein U3A55_14920 [Salarchaeum sp. III]|uniref:hypothetical protein n=1 Tax=Salarchaeum sp. III TaxID=3107927 RepID=UPI002ED9854C